MEIKGYKIHRKIGEGAMASVFLAEQESLGRKVALKVLAPALAGQSGFTERFLKEGKIIAFLKHPQIVNVYDLGSYDNNYYLAMEFLSGGTLEQRIENGLSPSESVELIIKISESLSFAHDNGVIHRDIKSQNIMFRLDDVPVLTDFGIARLMDNDPELTVPGRTMGSPLFMSPEQISGDSLDTRADLYSVGILFYKMLTNQLPYKSENFMAIALMHKTAPLPILPDELSGFQPVLEKLLAKSPDQRYSNAQELIDALRSIQSGTVAPLSEVSTSDTSTRLVDPPPTFEKMVHGTSDPFSVTEEATQPVLASGSGDDAGARTPTETSDQLSPPVLQASESAGKVFSLFRNRKLAIIGSALVGVIAVLVVFIHWMRSQSIDPIPSQSQSTATDQGTSTTSDTTAHLAPATAAHLMAPTTGGQISVHALRPGAGNGGTRQGTEQDTEQNRGMNPPPGRGHETASDQGQESKGLSKAEKIERLVAKGQRQLAANRLTLPAGDNCYETYQALLVLNPSGPEPESLLKKIGSAYANLAKISKSKGRLHQGLIYVGKGLALLPKDSDLLAMQKDLRKLLAEQDRLMQERTRLIEQEKIKRAAELAAMERRLKAQKKAEHEKQRQRVKEPKPVQSKALPEAAVPDPSNQVNDKNDPPKEQDVKPKPAVQKQKRLFGTF